MCVCERVCVSEYARACVCVCVCVCARACVYMSVHVASIQLTGTFNASARTSGLTSKLATFSKGSCAGSTWFVCVSPWGAEDSSDKAAAGVRAVVRFSGELVEATARACTEAWLLYWHASV